MYSCFRKLPSFWPSSRDCISLLFVGFLSFAFFLLKAVKSGPSREKDEPRGNCPAEIAHVSEAGGPIAFHLKFSLGKFFSVTFLFG